MITWPNCAHTMGSSAKRKMRTVWITNPAPDGKRCTSRKRAQELVDSRQAKWVDTSRILLLPHVVAERERQRVKEELEAWQIDRAIAAANPDGQVSWRGARKARGNKRWTAFPPGAASVFPAPDQRSRLTREDFLSSLPIVPISGSKPEPRDKPTSRG
jgi:hypothetical protein